MQLHESVASALSALKSGWRVFVHGGAATPIKLLEGLGGAADLKDLEFVHLHTEGTPHDAKHFRVANLFVGSSMRSELDYDRVDYLPVFLSEIPALFRSRRRPLDAALIQVSPPDAHGYCSLGLSVDIARSAVECAGTVIAQINPKMPRVLGDGLLHVNHIQHAVELESPLFETSPAPLSEDEKKLGSQVASLIEDGSTLQMGIGAVPDAVMASLGGHKYLGIHTEMWSDGVLPLLQSGAVDNSKKRIYPGKTVSTFIMGSRKVYDFIHDNPSILQLTSDFVNSPPIIARNPKVVAINSAVQIDLTGQVCADSVGPRIVSGVGGQMDFMRGAALSEGGKPIIAILSRTSSGQSRLVSQLLPGAGVVTTRAHVHYVATEWGVADLYGRTLSERRKALVAIAHPDDRERLEREWHALYRKVSRRPV